MDFEQFKKEIIEMFTPEKQRGVQWKSNDQIFAEKYTKDANDRIINIVLTILEEYDKRKQL